MKSLELKKVTLGSADEITYGKIVADVLNTPPQGGFDAQQMRLRLKILDKLEKADGVLLLEDTEAKELQSATKIMKWIRLHSDIMQFVDDVEAMQEA